MNYNKPRVKAIIDRHIRNIIILNIKEIDFISINKIDINNDYSLIKIYVSFLDNKNSFNLFNLLKKKIPYFRNELAKHMSLYKVPNISFILDDRFIIKNKIDELLKKNN